MFDIILYTHTRTIRTRHDTAAAATKKNIIYKNKNKKPCEGRVKKKKVLLITQIKTSDT